MSTKKIDDLLKKTQTSKLNFEIKMDSEFDDLTSKLENEHNISISDFANQNTMVINVEEDLSEFDYDMPDEFENIEMPKDEVVLENIELERKQIDTSNAIIEYENVHLQYGNDKIINGVDLEIHEGEFVYFIGKSGAGKSSLTKMIYRDVVNTKGTIIVDKKDVTRMRQRNLHHLRRKIGVIFQDYKLLNDRTVYENVKYSLDVINYPKHKRKDQVLKILNLVGIINFKDNYPNELSGGQQQRVAIARAIVDDPKIIVADEPTGNLDPSNALVIMNLLEKINQSGTTVVMATHDVGIVNKFKHRVILVGEGKVLSDKVGGYKYE